MPPVSILTLAAKNVKLVRPTVNGYVAQREELERYSAELFELVTAGKVTLGVHDVYPLQEAARAHSDLESRKTKGKLLLSIE